jgi:urease accessory protein
MRLSQTRLATLSTAMVFAVFLLYFMAASPAFAHFVGQTGASWNEGLTHPFSRIDHLVVTLAIGIWGTRIGRSALWLLPTAFLLFMAIGAALGCEGIVLPGAEDGVAVSVAVVGVLLAVAVRPRLAIGALVAALFGLFHGYAHGVAMPETALAGLYGLGFLVASIVLQAVGIGLGLLARNTTGQKMLPIGAAAVAGIGITLILAL